MLNKNQIYQAVITDYTAEGQGVAHVEGCAVFIPNAIAGETVEVRIEKDTQRVDDRHITISKKTKEATAC